jgi:hypothetical protein
MALITCIECENKISDLAKSCAQCGAPTEISKKIPCFECGNLLDHGVTVCSSCGVDQALKPAVNITNKADAEIEPKIDEVKSEAKPIQNKVEVASNEKTFKIETDKKTVPKVETKSETVVEPKKTVPPLAKPVQSKKSGCLKPILIILIIILILGFVGYKMLPDDAKRELFESLGIENSSFAKQDLEAYINSQEAYSRQTLFGKWEISLIIYNTHESITIRQIDIKFRFSDFDEKRTFSKNLKPGKVFESVIIEKFDGHKNASYLGYEIVDARE